MDRVILHIDMNSYFASVEQQTNPVLRGKPIAVSGRPHIHSVVAAASTEAKKFGVRSGMSTWEAKRLCPNLIFIPGDPQKYLDVTSRIIKIFRDYTPIVEIFSIDEAWLELKNADPVAVALTIKRRIREEVGDRLTCSIGIAKNKFLAKLASEKKKPDGLTVINAANLDEMLLSSKLNDFCGIGRQVTRHLNAMGVYTVGQLRQIPADFLVSAFGRRGYDLHNMSRGIDESPVVAEEFKPEVKSFSHSLTLDKETADSRKINSTLLYLSEKVARRMRREGFAGRVVFCGGVQKALDHYTDNGKEIFTVGRELLMAAPIRQISVGVADLIARNCLNMELLPDRQRENRIVTGMDRVNDFFGENTVFRAAVLPVLSRDKRVAGMRGRVRFN
jgi:DNA polymerase IV